MPLPTDNPRLKYGPFLTIYNKDYIDRPKKPGSRFIQKQEFKDPIVEGGQEFLKMEKADHPYVLPEEDVDDYIDQVKKEKPKVGKMYFGTPIDKNVLNNYNTYNRGKTTYQVDYCDLIGDEMDRQEHKIVLPPDVYIPLTTQRCGYQDPRLMRANIYLDPLTKTKITDSLGQNEKINKIMKVQTGNSEYMERIGKLGDFITTYQMHGKIIQPMCDCLEHNIQN